MNRVNLYPTKVIQLFAISFIFMLCSCRKEKNTFLSDCNSKENSFKIAKEFFQNISQEKPISIYEDKNLYKIENYGIKCNCDRQCLNLQYNQGLNNVLINNSLYKASQLDSVLEKEIYAKFKQNMRFGYNLEIASENKTADLSLNQINSISILINSINCTTIKVRNKLAIELHDVEYDDLTQENKLQIKNKTSKCINIFFKNLSVTSTIPTDKK